MVAINIRNCPICNLYTMEKNTFSEDRYKCRVCGYSPDEWALALNPGPLLPLRDRLIASKPKPSTFGRTKSKKPTKKQLEALSAAIDGKL